MDSSNNDDGGNVAKKEKAPSFACTHLLNAKYLSLATLVFQMVANVLMIRSSRASGTTYLATTVVFMSEICKTVVNTMIEFNLHRRMRRANNLDPDDDDDGHDHSTSFVRHMKESVFVRDTMKLAVPALLYVIQNNLIFVALENLSVPVFMITNQGKILTTAVLCRIMLDKRLSVMQYISLCLLAIGVATIQLSSSKESESSDDKNKSSNMLGFVAVVLSCFTSSFAGVYFERMLKRKDPAESSEKPRSVYVRNVQLSTWSMLLSLFPIVTKDLAAIQKDGFFQGYRPIVWAIAISSALNGLVVSLVMKHADNVLKGFATSIAIFVASALAVLFQDAELNVHFTVGSILVLSAVRIYSDYPWKPPAEVRVGDGDDGDDDIEAAKLLPSPGEDDDNDVNVDSLSKEDAGTTIGKRAVAASR